MTDFTPQTKKDRKAATAIVQGQSSGGASDSALGILESMAMVYDRPERWPEVCQKWADASTKAASIKRATPLLKKLFRYTNEKEDSAYLILPKNKCQTRTGAHQNTLIINNFGMIEYIGDEAAEILGFSIDENVEEALTESLAVLVRDVRHRGDKICFTDVIGRDGIRHLARAALKKSNSPDIDYLKISLCNLSLPAPAESYIRQKLLLTNTEIDILTRSIQRQSIPFIAKKRESTVNTIRTHINKIIKKFGCRSFGDVFARTFEIIAYNEKHLLAAFDFAESITTERRSTGMLRLRSNNAKIEYSRYGDSKMRPLVVLHSMEYGIAPPRAFINEAAHSGYCIFTPVRPGFGNSSPVNSVRQCAENLDEFLALLKLTDVTLVAFSTAGPTALQLMRRSNRIERSVLVNYAFDQTNKIDQLKPKWVKGLLVLGLGSKESFKFSFRLTRNMLSLFGHERFYKKLYEGCKEDLAYLADHSDGLKIAAELLLTANSETIRLELMSNFKQNPLVNQILETQSNIMSIRGRNTHHVPLNPVKMEAARLHIPLFVMEHCGRNCVYQRPGEFFRIISEMDNRAFVQSNINLKNSAQELVR